MRSCSVRGGIALLFLVAGTAPARADAKRDQQARQLYQSGRQAYDAGDYGHAYDDFRRAYLVSSEPALLYNIASALQGLGRPHEAADSLRAYLRAVPEDPERRQIEGRIRALEESQRMLDAERETQERSREREREQERARERERESATRPTPEPAPAPTETASTSPAPPIPAPRAGRGETIAGFSVAAVGLAALVGGVVASVAARGQADQVRSAAARGAPFDPSVEQAGKRDDLIAGVLYGVGAAAVVAGAVVASLGLHRRALARRAAVSLTPSVAPGRVNAVLEVNF